MENFDQFIKEKIENTEHSFKKEYWDLFTRKAGWTAPVSALKAVILSMSGVALVSGGIGLGVYLSDVKKGAPEQDSTENQSTVIHSTDSTITPSHLIIDSIQIAELKPEKNSKEESRSQVAKPTIKVEEETVTPSHTIPDKREEKKESIDYSRMRILIIDPDTIKSNS